MTRQRAPFWFLRTMVVAAAVIFLAAGAHILAGGQLPPPPGRKCTGTCRLTLMRPCWRFT